MRSKPLFTRLVLAGALVALAGFRTPAAGQTMTWPQQLTDPEGTIDIYQPQFETFKGNAVTGRAAVGLTAPGKQTPVFGAFWFSAVADVDQAADQVTLRDIKVTNVRWPNMTPALEQRFKEVVGASVPIAGLHLSYEAFSASLATAEREKKSMAELKNDPPAMVFTKELAVLLLFDGEPRFKDIENSPYERAMNTPLAVVREKKSGTCYLTSGALWYTAKAPLGPWQVTANPPADLVKNMPKDESAEPAPKVPPRIIAASAPTEVISTDGEPSWKSLPGGKLLYVENTETPWVRELETPADLRAALRPLVPREDDGRPVDVRARRPVAGVVQGDPGGLGPRRHPLVGSRHRRGRRRRARRGDPADDGHQARRGEVRVAVPRQPEVRADPRHECLLCHEYRGADHPGREQVLRGRQRRLVHRQQPERAVDGRLRGARAADPADPAEFAHVQRHATARVPVDAERGLHGLHARLHVVVPLLRRASVRHRLLLPAVLRGLLLPATADVGLPRGLQPVDRLELRRELGRPLHAGRRRLEQRLGRLGRRLPSVWLLRRVLRRRLPQPLFVQHAAPASTSTTG